MSNIDDILYKSEAYLNILEQKKFLNSYEIYMGNYHELIKELNKHEKLDLSILLSNKRGIKRLDELQGRITRYLHNYLAAAYSLSKVTIAYYKKYYKSKGLISEYDIKVKNDLDSKPITSFITELRNYVQHYKIPSISTTTKFESELDNGYSTFVQFQKDESNGNKKWEKLINKYKKENEKPLIIKKEILDFHNLFHAFTQWFIDETERLLNDDKKKVEELKIKLNIERLKKLIRFYLTFDEESIVRFENSILPKLSRKEQISIKREKNNRKKASKILRTLKKYINIDSNFEDKVYKLYK